MIRTVLDALRDLIRSATNAGGDDVSTGSVRCHDYYYLCAILVAGAFVFGRSLGTPPLTPWDEGIYGVVASNAVYHGDYLVPHVYWMADGRVAYQPFLEKPPLVLWLQAVSIHLLGASEFALRLPSAVGATLSGVVVYLFGRDLRDRPTGFIAAVAFFTTVGFYASGHGGRTAATDALHVFGGLTFVYLVWRVAAGESPGARTYRLLGVAAAFVVLVKGFAAGVFVVAVLPLVAVAWRRFASRRFVETVAITLALALPWPAFAYHSEGREFVDQIFVYQVVNRVTGVHPTPFEEQALFEFMQYPYFRYLPALFDPWVFYLVPAVAYLSVTVVRAGATPDRRNVAFLWWWFGSVLLFFATTGNNPWYVMPAYPAGTLLVAWTVVDAARGDRRAAGAVVAGTVLALLFSFRLQGLSPLALSPHLFEGSVLAAGWVYAGGLVAGTVATLAVPLVDRYGVPTRRLPVPDGGITAVEDRRGVAGVVVALVVSLALVGALVHVPPAGGGYEEQRELGTAIGEAVGDEVLYVDPNATTDAPHFATAFYAGDVDIRATSVESLDENPDARYALVSGERYHRIERPHHARAASAPNDVVLIRFTDTPQSEG